MDLILWRHAEAEGESGGPDDLDRALTTKGERQAQRMAAWLHQRLPEGTRILVSPAKRTQQTVRALVELSNRKARTLDAIGPHATADNLLGAADWPHARQPVLIVGHQPALGEVAAWLIGGEAQAWSVRKGAVWWIRQRLRAEVAQNILVAVQSPELL
ncbi:MAG TPA: phosphohistidine phosphatase SixA [Burkholderiaceae bacterium]|nr:phosphohistidine phosphatase SixA [Burkholderiaceae bacterium]